MWVDLTNFSQHRVFRKQEGTPLIGKDPSDTLGISVRNLTHQAAEGSVEILGVPANSPGPTSVLEANSTEASRLCKDILLSSPYCPALSLDGTVPKGSGGIRTGSALITEDEKLPAEELR